MHFKTSLMVAVSVMMLSGAALAQAPAGSTAVCKDGTYSSAASKRGACSGHKGIGQWLGGAEPAAAAAPVPSRSTVTSSAPTQAPAGSTAVCKDGTYSSAASKRGACSGHQGIGQWLGGAEPAASNAPVSSPPMATQGVPIQARAPTSAPVAAPARQVPMPAPARSGGAGQVWVNTKSKVYHCQGDRYYGNTKAGGYMTEAAAVAEGDRPDHGKACH